MKHLKLILAILMVLFLANCITEYDIPPDTWEEFYIQEVVIGNQVWTSEDMKYPINNQSKLYNWTGAANVCPKGWHLPTKEDWDALSDVSGFPADIGYWSYTTVLDDPEYPEKVYVFYVNSSNGSLEHKSDYRSNLYSVRCIKNAGSLQSSSSGGDLQSSSSGSGTAYDDNDFVGCVNPIAGTCRPMTYEQCKWIGTAIDECPN